MTFTCCIGMTNGSDGLNHQRTCSVSPKISRNRDPLQSAPRRSDATIISTTASALEDAVCSRLEYRDVVDVASNANGNGNGDCGERAGEEEIDDGDGPVQFFPNDDARMLRCRPLLTDRGEEPAPTIFGIGESVASLSLGRVPKAQDGSVHEGSVPVRVTILDPRFDHAICNRGDRERDDRSKGCCCHHPRGNWTRKNETFANGKAHPMETKDNGDAENFSSYHADVKIVDLTKIQDLRRSVGIGEPYPCFDTPGKAFHLLRSVLDCNSGGLHSASPWNQLYYRDEMACNNDVPVPGREDCAADQVVVALLVKYPVGIRENGRSVASDARFWDDTEQREVDELLDFHTGDAAPSYFLHSTSQLSGGSQFLLDLAARSEETALFDREETLNSSCPSSCSLLLVYRHLPPRDVLSCHRLGCDEKFEYVGCLRETYLEDVDEAELDTGSKPPTQTGSLVKHRMVSPPYQSHEQEYPGLLDTLLKRIAFIQEEAQKIPQWTAWPEQNHYSDASWNVFPLCYTFPANEVARRKWIQKTCTFVPETTRLLRGLGPALRTALFSRLDPRTRLGTHTGWSDLANHVLRVHVPLVVPGGEFECAGVGERGDGDCNVGLCGTWVDGCVETHEEGRVISFDDSKVHRAFNYSDKERIVLIVDLLRPNGLPMGTATGGHTDELDAFINGF